MIFTSTKFGYDISTWQDDPNVAGTVNFDKMRDSGASFVIFRASVGDQLDVDFPTYKVNSRGKLPRGVYHYYWNNIDPKIQAQKCLAAIGGEQIEGRVWLDLETTTAGAFVGPTHWRVFLETIRAAGLRVGIYTGYFWWKTYAATADMTYFGQFPLWQAWYTFDPSIVLIARGWDKLTIWQDTSSYPGVPAGVESPTIDHNQWNDAVDFAAEWGTPTPPPIGGVMETWKVIITELNVRSGIGTSYPVITTVKKDDVIDGVLDVASNWIHISKRNGIALDGWCSGNTLYVTKYTPPARVVTGIDIALAAGSVVTRKYSDGTTESETA